MSKPFQIILSFNQPVTGQVGSILAVDVEIEGLEPDEDRNYAVIMGLSHALVAHSKSVTVGPPEDVKQAFLNFMQSVWEDGPVPIPVELTSREVADA